MLAAAQYQIAVMGQASIECSDVCLVADSPPRWPRWRSFCESAGAASSWRHGARQISDEFDTEVMLRRGQW